MKAFVFLGLIVAVSSQCVDHLPNGEKCPATGLDTYPDEVHCSQYWECYDGCANHMTCQNSFLYDIAHKWCNTATQVYCGDRDCDGLPCRDSNPDNDFDCPKPAGFFADPKNCIKYYQCSEDIATRHTCEKKNGIQLLYNPDKTWCDWPDRVECGDRPECNENDENCNEHHITTERPTVCDSMPCSHGDGFYPEGPCAKCYCRCVGGAHYENCCPDGLFFNEEKEVCDWPGNIDGC